MDRCSCGDDECPCSDDLSYDCSCESCRREALSNFRDSPTASSYLAASKYDYSLDWNPDDFESDS